MIQFQHVGLRYNIGPEVLSDISFTLQPDSFYYLTGPSGAGKTSLMRLLYLGQPPTRGLIDMFGTDINQAGRDEKTILRRQIGVVFQDFRLLDHLTVFDNVALPLRLAGRDSQSINADVSDLLDWVGLGDHTDRLPKTLSGGQKQRVAIARAVINRPKLLLADEPTGNVDDKIAVKLMHLFEELNRLGTTTIVATHNPGIVQRFPHHQLTLSDKSVEILPPGEPIPESPSLLQA